MTDARCSPNNQNIHILLHYRRAGGSDSLDFVATLHFLPETECIACRDVDKLVAVGIIYSVVLVKISACKA